MLLPDILRTLILHLEKGESVLEALARLGKSQTKTKKIPKWKLKKQAQATDSMVVDSAIKEDPEQVRIREAVDAITGAADQLLTRGQTEIYEEERGMLIRQYRREAGEDWVEPKAQEVQYGEAERKMWEYRWTDGRDGDAKQGPYEGDIMRQWQEAGYFGEGVEFRREGDAGEWLRVVDFV